MYKMFKRYEIQSKFWSKIKKHCKKKKIIFFSTPQNLSDLKTLIKLKVPAIKVGSDDFTNIPLIESYLKFNIPVILSTGMSNINDFKKVLKIKNISKKKLSFYFAHLSIPLLTSLLISINYFQLKKLQKIL